MNRTNPNAMVVGIAFINLNIGLAFGTFLRKFENLKFYSLLTTLSRALILLQLFKLLLNREFGKKVNWAHLD